MQAAVIIFPGSNCDRDAAVCLERLSGRAPELIWHEESELPSVDLIIVPGGFSYGDYLRGGALAARSPVLPALVQKAKAGVAILGICNGFQILTESGLLPGALRGNDSTFFTCKQVWLKPESTKAPFMSAYEGKAVQMPVAHHEGNYYAGAELLKRLEGEGQIAFRYCHEDGRVDEAANPNGSVANIAGVFNEAGNVLGLMPHPERAFEEVLGAIGGRPLFESLLAFFDNKSKAA